MEIGPMMLLSYNKDMYELEFMSFSEKDTGKAGKAIAALLKKGSIVALYGDLAAGKTALCRYLFEAKGFVEGFSSPTFTVINEYINDKMQKAYHLDAYRLTSSEELYYAGWDEITEGEFCVIEWADIVEDILDEGAIRVYIYRTERENERRIIIKLSRESDYNALKELLK